MSDSTLGNCLVVGGCGFLGYHLVGHLVASGDYASVTVLDRNVQANLCDDATYVQADIGDADCLAQQFGTVAPSVIFHAASPISALPTSRLAEFAKTNIDGTKSLLAIAKASPSVKVFVYTSTCDVYANPPHQNVAETHAMWAQNDMSNEYNRTKAVADELVRAANGPELRTACLRLGHAYGERQVQGLVEMLDACEGTKPLVQVGDGTNLMEVVSAANVATAHGLTAKLLLQKGSQVGEGAAPETRIDGEAFNISDGAPVPFWHHVRVIWGVARGPEALENITVIPAWVMRTVVVTLEWALWLGTLNTVKPPVALRRNALEYCTSSHTYNVDKATTRLGFRPVVDHDAVVARAAKYALEQEQLKPA